jgi:hypothetical protein
MEDDGWRAGRWRLLARHGDSPPVRIHVRRDDNSVSTDFACIPAGGIVRIGIRFGIIDWTLLQYRCTLQERRALFPAPSAGEEQPVDPHVAAALEQLRAALAATPGRSPRCLVAIYPDGSLVRVTVPGQGVCGQPVAPVPAPPTTPTAAPRTPAGRLREGILAVLGREGPLKAAGIARRLDRANSGHFREVLGGLVEDGLVVLCPGNCYGLPPTDTLP